jgi:hypothetical protein
VGGKEIQFETCSVANATGETNFVTIDTRTNQSEANSETRTLQSDAKHETRTEQSEAQSETRTKRSEACCDWWLKSYRFKYKIV